MIMVRRSRTSYSRFRRPLDGLGWTVVNAFATKVSAVPPVAPSGLRWMLLWRVSAARSSTLWRMERLPAATIAVQPDRHVGCVQRVREVDDSATPFTVQRIRAALDEGHGVRETARRLKVSAAKVSEVRRTAATTTSDLHP